MKNPDMEKGQENLDPNHESQSAKVRQSFNRPSYYTSTFQPKRKYVRDHEFRGSFEGPRPFDTDGPEISWLGCGEDGLVGFDGRVEDIFDIDREEVICPQ